MVSGSTFSDELMREHREIDTAINSISERLYYGSVQHELLTETCTLLRRHIYLEEVFLFPPLRDAGMVMPTFVMMREHGQLWRTMDVLMDCLANESDSSRLKAACVQLQDQLIRHNSKEEPIIYPIVDTALPPHTNAELTRFIRTGRVPDGWVCQQAGA